MTLEVPSVAFPNHVDPGSALSDLETQQITSSANLSSPTPKSLLQLLNISIAFLGIQFAYAIQIGQTSPLFERLGSPDWLTSLLWCAGPITGIIVQPIVGAWSDKTWTRLGRRRPFLLAGAFLTALSLILMPNSSNLVMAAILLWMLDASINISQGPYRALVPDVVPQKQQAFTYTLMGFTIGLGSIIATMVGWKFSDVHFLFYLGAVAMLAAMLWTIITTPETERFAQPTAPHEKAAGNFIQQTWASIVDMPQDIKKLCLMHSFTWFGLQCLFIFLSLYIGRSFGHSTQLSSSQLIMWSYLIFNAVCFVVSPCIGALCKTLTNKGVHTMGLLCLGTGLIATFFLKSPNQLYWIMGLMGIGWATTLSIPFAILAKKAPSGKEGVLMGTFNIFIAAPQFIACLLAGVIVSITHNTASALVLGGVAVLLSAFLLQWVEDSP